jgi:Domain of unknown function (DUF1929)/Bacterial Ig-like domain (group 2)/Glyoxal oxidase N-terminus/Kelch motif
MRLRIPDLIAPIAVFVTGAILLHSATLGLHGGTPVLVSLAVTQVIVPGNSSQLPTGAVRQFVANGNYSDGSTRYLTQNVTWTSASNAIATVTPSMGLVTAVAPGTVAINATLSGIQGASTLTVVSANLTGIVVTPAAWSMQAGTTQQFNATAEFGAATAQDVTITASWKSSDNNVATVSSTGIVSAVGSGTAIVGVKFDNKSGSTTLTVTSAAPPNLGYWTAPQNLGMVPIHAGLLRTGQVLFFGLPSPSPARLYDPVTNSVTDATAPFATDLFCSGQSFLSDGRLMIVGGMNDETYPPPKGIYTVTFFDPRTNTWSQGPPMSYARWYPTTVPMPDGTIFVLGGTDQNGAKIQVATESYNPGTNTWTELPLSAYEPKPPDNYPLMTVLDSGKVFYAAPRQDSQMYNPATQSWTFVSNMNLGKRYHAAVALLSGSQKVMVVGGAGSMATNGADPTNTTEVIDFSAASPAWSYAAPMNIARYNANLVYLADGTLLTVGGDQNSSYEDPVEQPELYNPSTGQWTLMAPQVGIRAYHSVALLLPDGRVISAGSDSKKPLENTYEIYSPPYLSNGPRPVINAVARSITYGQRFAITTPDAANIKRVALIRPGATTHANHMDDHAYIDLTWVATKGLLAVNAPASANTAPPGYYMVVIVNSNGVPSAMPFVQLKVSADGVPALSGRTQETSP